jgi:hypothetical protein
MERFYIRAYYLKAAHYLFFSLAVFSLTFALSVWSTFLVESIALLIFTLIYINASLWIAYFFYKEYKIQVKNVIVVSRYAKPYIILGIVVFALTELLIIFFPEIDSLLFSMMFINFYYTFVIILGASLYLVKPIRMLFEYQSHRALTRGKQIASRFSHLSELTNYKIGTNPFVDEVLDDIWSNRTYPVPHVQRLEIELCQSKISEIEGRIELADKMNWSPELRKHLEREKRKYEKKIGIIMKYNY